MKKRTVLPALLALLVLSGCGGAAAHTAGARPRSGDLNPTVVVSGAPPQTTEVGRSA